jgi:tol-pal system protein YbgF|tara:strand:- start:142326 stop:143342 length:1017 start_codon:yes stop_codon:yes gene_type:complete
MFKAPAVAFACLMLAASPAMAQRGAPITQGVTSSDLSTQVATVRQQNAELKVQVNNLLGDIMTLTGRVETMEFKLSQANDLNEGLQRDNESLSDSIGALRKQMDAQSRTLAALEARLGGAEYVDPSADPDAGYPGATQGGDYPSASRAGGLASGPTQLISPNSGSTPSGMANSASGVREAPTPVSNNPSEDGLNLPSGSLGTISASNLPGEAGPLFAAAKSKLIQFDYAGAEAAFRLFLEKFGNDPQAGEAHYWLGETLYQQKAYADSGAAYTTMIRSFPNDPRAPDALVKLARAMRLVGDKEKACLALDTLPKRYPNASGVTRDLSAVERTKSGCDN